MIAGQRNRTGPSKAIDVDDSFGEGFRSLLREIVPDAALDDPVLGPASAYPTFKRPASIC